jgi:hypothetical protein
MTQPAVSRGYRPDLARQAAALVLLLSPKHGDAPEGGTPEASEPSAVARGADEEIFDGLQSSEAPAGATVAVCHMPAVSSAFNGSRATG